jgi:serine/threonine-protein kinase HipA
MRALGERLKLAHLMASSKARDAFKVFLDATELGGMQQVGTLYRQSERTNLPVSFAYATSGVEQRHAFIRCGLVVKVG